MWLTKSAFWDWCGQAEMRWKGSSGIYPAEGVLVTPGIQVTWVYCAIGSDTGTSHFAVTCLSGGLPLPWETLCVSLGRRAAIPHERQTALWSVFPGFVFLSSSQLQVRESSRNPPGLCIGVLQRNRTNRICICLYDCFIFVVVHSLSRA